MLAKNALSALAGPGCQLTRQLINSETEFAKASQDHANEFIVRVLDHAEGKMLTTLQIGYLGVVFLMPKVRLELATPGLQTQCSSH